MKPYAKGKAVITLSPIDMEICKRMGMAKRYFDANDLGKAVFAANQAVRRMME